MRILRFYRIIENTDLCRCSAWESFHNRDRRSTIFSDRQIIINKRHLTAISLVVSFLMFAIVAH